MSIPAKFQGRSFKSITFSNTAGGTEVIFTVTGSVIANVVCVCRTTVTTGGGINVELGVVSATALLIAQTDAALIAQHEIWHDAAPANQIEQSSVVDECVISDGSDIGLLLSGQVNTGTLDFYCFWSALSADGLVVAA